jgi:DNA topoisomerase-6 subunit A
LETLNNIKRLKKTDTEVISLGRELCEKMLLDLERAKRPSLKATKCSLDNSHYNSKIGYLTPGSKKVQSELNATSVKKISRAFFMLEILLRNVEISNINTKRELYYVAKGLIKHESRLRPLDFQDQDESDSVIDFICEMIEAYREELNCVADDRGGQTYSKQLIVNETELDGNVATVDLSTLGTAPYQPRNRPQNLILTAKTPIDFGIIIESQGTANTLVANGFTKRHNCIVVGAQGVPSNAVRAWVRRIQDQLKIPLYFFGDLDAYTLQNIYRTLKAGSASSLIRNADYCAPEVRFLGVLPKDIAKYDLVDYPVRENDPQEARSLKKAKDALANDPFFRDRKNADLKDILEWLVKNKRRCEQQSYISVNPRDPQGMEKIIIDKIKKKDYI